ncbi:hypothetical protein BZG01_14620 [Labilibaculum manganireducens]|uniref:Uncharacterized protein n=1 Tax=Labilibaculum manganireducens TaxID=1940525 RepID=A0A2N3I1D3_9BACT|nr:hypothetical protein BZG01_14620 [Labilibaculum manganireducens]
MSFYYSKCRPCTAAGNKAKTYNFPGNCSKQKDKRQILQAKVCQTKMKPLYAMSLPYNNKNYSLKAPLNLSKFIAAHFLEKYSSNISDCEL